jgi:hypothetical protein
MHMLYTCMFHTLRAYTLMSISAHCFRLCLRLRNTPAYTRDMNAYTRDMKAYTRDMKAYTRDMNAYTRDMKAYTRDMKAYTRDMKAYTRDMNAYTRDMKAYTPDMNATNAMMPCVRCARYLTDQVLRNEKFRSYGTWVCPCWQTARKARPGHVAAHNTRAASWIKSTKNTRLSCNQQVEKRQGQACSVEMISCCVFVRAGVGSGPAFRRGKIDVCLVLCGLNDFKRLYLVRGCEPLCHDSVCDYMRHAA